MKTQIIRMRNFLLGMMAALVYVSCSNEDEVVVPVTKMDPQAMCNNDKWWTSRFGLSFTLNGEEVDYAQVHFTPQANDTTQLMMTIDGIKPRWFSEAPERSWPSRRVEYLQLPVDVVPDEEEIRFSATEKTDEYDLAIQGVYTGEHVDIQCEYTVTGGIATNTPYVLPLDSEHIRWDAANLAGTVEWEGQAYEKPDFAQMMMEKAVAERSRQIAALKMFFRDDAWLELSLKYASDTDFTPWMSVRYWYTEGKNQLCLDITSEQDSQFYDEFFRGTPDAWAPPFIPYGGSDRYLLVMDYEVQGENVRLSLEPDFGTPLLGVGIETQLDGDALTPQERKAMELWYELVLYIRYAPVVCVENPSLISMQLDRE